MVAMKFADVFRQWGLVVCSLISNQSFIDVS